jgi:hypothetical protein
LWQTTKLFFHTEKKKPEIYTDVDNRSEKNDTSLLACIVPFLIKKNQLKSKVFFGSRLKKFYLIVVAARGAFSDLAH